MLAQFSQLMGLGERLVMPNQKALRRVERFLSPRRQECDEQTAQSAVAIHGRVDCLELNMRQCCFDEQPASREARGRE